MQTRLIRIGSVLKILIFTVLLFIIVSCSKNDIVNEYFESHGISYPVDVTAVSLWGIEYSGIEKDELTQPGARDFIEDGIVFIKDFFLRQNVQAIVPGVKAIVVSKPVLFRGESEEVGIMVKIEAYGEGEPGSAIELPVEWLGEKKRFWKKENYAYFNRNGSYKWEHSGWVF